MNQYKLGPWLVALAALLWAVDAPFRKLLTQDLSSTTIVFMEHLVIAALVLVFLAKYFSEFRDLSWREWLAVGFFHAELSLHQPIRCHPFAKDPAVHRYTVGRGSAAGETEQTLLALGACRDVRRIPALVSGAPDFGIGIFGRRRGDHASAGCFFFLGRLHRDGPPRASEIELSSDDRFAVSRRAGFSFHSGIIFPHVRGDRQRFW